MHDVMKTQNVNLQSVPFFFFNFIALTRFSNVVITARLAFIETGLVTKKVLVITMRTSGLEMKSYIIWPLRKITNFALTSSLQEDGVNMLNMQSLRSDLRTTSTGWANWEPTLETQVCYYNRFHWYHYPKQEGHRKKMNEAFSISPI